MMITVKFECEECGHKEEDCSFFVDGGYQSIEVICPECGEKEVEYR